MRDFIDNLFIIPPPSDPERTAGDNLYMSKLETQVKELRQKLEDLKVSTQSRSIELACKYWDSQWNDCDKEVKARVKTNHLDAIDASEEILVSFIFNLINLNENENPIEIVYKALSIQTNLLASYKDNFQTSKTHDKETVGGVPVLIPEQFISELINSIALDERELKSVDKELKFSIDDISKIYLPEVYKVVNHSPFAVDVKDLFYKLLNTSRSTKIAPEDVVIYGKANIVYKGKLTDNTELYAEINSIIECLNYLISKISNIDTIIKFYDSNLKVAYR